MKESISNMTKKEILKKGQVVIVGPLSGLSEMAVKFLRQTFEGLKWQGVMVEMLEDPEKSALPGFPIATAEGMENFSNYALTVLPPDTLYVFIFSPELYLNPDSLATRKEALFSRVPHGMAILEFKTVLGSLLKKESSQSEPPLENPDQ